MRWDLSRRGLRDSLVNGMRAGCCRIRPSLTSVFVIEPVLAPPNPAAMWQDHFDRLRHEKKRRKKPPKQSHLGRQIKAPPSPGGYERPSAIDLMLDLPRHAFDYTHLFCVQRNRSCFSLIIRRINTAELGDSRVDDFDRIFYAPPTQLDRSVAFKRSRTQQVATQILDSTSGEDDEVEDDGNDVD